MDLTKVEATTKERPKNVFEVRSFLGLAGYYRRFVENFSRIACLMTRLSCKKTLIGMTSVIVSSHSLSHSSKKTRKSTSLSHRKPNQKRVRWTWFHQSPYILFNFVNLKALLIVLILILALSCVIYM